MSGSHFQPRRDPDAGLTEASEFILLLPEAVFSDRPRCAGVVRAMRLAFPDAVFRTVECERIESCDGLPFQVDEPEVIPMMGVTGVWTDRVKMLRRPSDQRMAEMRAVIRAAVDGPAALH